MCALDAPLVKFELMHACRSCLHACYLLGASICTTCQCMLHTQADSWASSAQVYIMKTCVQRGGSSWVICLAGSAQPPHATDLPADTESMNNIQGIFPKGCQWRDIQHDGQAKKFWAQEEYEYWHGDVKQWKPDMPDTCTVQGAPAKQG